MKVARINTKGLIQIHQALGKYHRLGADHFTPPMLNAWAQEAEENFSNGNGCHFEIRAMDSINGSPVTFTVSEDGYAVEDVNEDGQEHLVTPIATEADAQGFFFALEQCGQLFHPEEDPATIVNGETGAPVFTPAQVEQVRLRLQEAYAVMDDPCEYVLDLLRPATDEERSNGPSR